MKRLILILLLIPVTAPGQEDGSGPRVGNPHGDMNLDCMLCHTEQSWDEEGRAGEFDHAVTGFALEGLHIHARCRDCHREPVFAHVGTACADCHQDIHRGREGPSCGDCHTPAGWVDRDRMRRDHDATALPLVGAHERVDCDACHSGAAGSDYVGTPVDCYDCHAEVYHGTTSPDHEASGFGTDCIRCHGVFSATWGAGDFIHAASFPLTGAHRYLECAACHENGFTGTPTDCVACHQDDYDSTLNPAHPAAGFSTDCRPCHATSAWVPSSFDHGTTAFLLTGAHRPLDCLACHDTGYAGTPTDCVACHQTEYDGTTGPNHVASNFPVTCADCHSTSAWIPSTWDHETLFPIRGGAHSGTTCTDCHVVPTDYSAFECILCHEHNQSDSDNDHSEVSGYFYQSSECFRCHPRGTN
ncbi:MAG: hypothetical protein ABFS42_07245 [Candidatus Krumholzibacteriota bacterium]